MVYQVTRYVASILCCLSIITGCHSFSPDQDEKAPVIQVGGKSYVKIEARNVRDTIKIYSRYWPLLTPDEEFFTEEYKIISDSSFFLTFDTSIPTKYDLTLGKDITTGIFLVPGDTLTIKVDYKNHKNVPGLTFEGAYSQINLYLHEIPPAIAYSIEGAGLFNDPFKVQTPEKTLLRYKQKSDSLARAQQAYVERQAAQYNLPDWFVQHERISSVLFAAYHQLVLPNYWKHFFKIDLAIPEGYFTSIKPIDITNANALYSLGYYHYVAEVISRVPAIEKFKKQFMDSCKTNNLEDLRGTNAYTAYQVKHFKYVGEKAGALLPDELFYPFLINSFFRMTRVLDSAQRQVLLDFLKTKLQGTNYLSFVLQHYESNITHLRPGKAAPGFYLLNAEQDKYLTLGDLKGKVLLLNFWFPGCKPCIYEIPHERKLMEKYGNDGFTIVNICMESTEKLWRSAIRKYGLAAVNVLTQGNWERRLKEAYNISGFPHYVLVDREGKIVENQTHPPSDPQLSELIEATLNN